jgi:hypothetical protein
LRRIAGLRSADIADDRLPTIIDVDMFDADILPAPMTESSEDLDLVA